MVLLLACDCRVSFVTVEGTLTAIEHPHIQFKTGLQVVSTAPFSGDLLSLMLTPPDQAGRKYDNRPAHRKPIPHVTVAEKTRNLESTDFLERIPTHDSSCRATAEKTSFEEVRAE